MPSPRWSALLAWVALAGAVVPASAQRPLNLGFEMSSVAYADRPWGWTQGWSTFANPGTASFVLDDRVYAEGGRSLRVEVTDSGAEPPRRELMVQVPAAFARGKEVRFDALIRTTGLRGQAFVAVEAWGDRVVPAADTETVAGSGTPGWRPVHLAIRVPSDPSVHSLVLVVGAQGVGSAWFDGLTLTLDGFPVSALPDVADPPTPAELAWLAGRSVPLQTVLAPTPGSTPDDRDLALFARIVGNAPIIGLGETTHGTSEFFLVKHRLLEYLVRTEGFDVFAIEANQLATERINAYVLGGPGAAADVMRAMFAVWNTEEMLSLVEWMRGYNAGHPARPVRFIGYDMQDHQRPADSLLTFLRARDPQLGARVDAETRTYRAQPSYATPQLPDSVRRDWSLSADRMADEVAGHRTRWLAGAESGADSVRIEWAVHEADLYRQAARLNASLNSPDRDSLMAANLAWAMRTLYPASRVVVWAHDVHVSHGGDSSRSFNGGAQMGAYLKHSYGMDYRAVSLLTAGGTYRATRSFTDHAMLSVRAFPAPAGSLEAALAALPRPAGSPGVIVDLRVPEEDPAAAWLWAARPVRSVGYAAYDYGFDLTAVMPLEFDGAVFVDQTNASHGMPSRP